MAVNADSIFSLLNDDELFESIEPFDLIYDSNNIHFYPMVFFKELFMQCFFPFTFFMSRNPVVNSFSIQNGIIYSYLSNVNVFVMVLSYFLASGNCGEAVWTPLLFFVTHRGMIALKYATMSPTELDRLYTTADPEVIATYQNQLQLVNVLVSGVAEVAQFGIASAAAKAGIRLHEVAFSVSKSIEVESGDDQSVNWRRLAVFKKCLSRCSSGETNFRVSVSGACMGLLTMSKFDTEDDPAILNKITMILIAVQVIIPFVVLAQTEDSPGFLELDTFTIVFYISSTIANITFYRLVLIFLNACLVSAMRAVEVATALGEMIRPAESCLTGNLVTARTEAEEPPSQESLAALKTNPIKTGSEALVWPRVFKKPSAEPLSQLNAVQLSALHQSGNAWGVFSGEELEEMRRKDDMKNMTSGDSKTKDSATATTVGRKLSANMDGMRIEGGKPKFPRVSFHCANNVFAWLYTRLIIQTFGERLMFRVDAYLGFFTVMAALNMVIIVCILVLHDEVSGTTHADLVASSAYFPQMLVLVGIISAYVIFIIHLKSSINNAYAEHVYGLMSAVVQQKHKHQRHEVKYAKQCINLGEAQQAVCEKELAEEERTVDALETALDTIDLMNSEHPASLLGLECTNGLASSFLTTIVSFFTYVCAICE